MCVSHLFVKCFLAIFFHSLLFWAETYMVCFIVIYVLRNKISDGSDQRHRISRLTPIVKIAYFWQHHVYTWGLQGNFTFYVWSNWNLISEYIKNVDPHHISFSLKEVIKKLLPKCMWQTNVKSTVALFSVIIVCIKLMTHIWQIFYNRLVNGTEQNEQ